MRWLCALAAFLTLLTGTLALTLPGSEVLAVATSAARSASAEPSIGRADTVLAPEQVSQAALPDEPLGASAQVEAARMPIGPGRLGPVDPNLHATLVVTVLDRRDRPCANATVFVRIRPERASGFAMATTLATDAQGRARTSVLARVPIAVGTPAWVRQPGGKEPNVIWDEVAPLDARVTSNVVLHRVE